MTLRDLIRRLFGGATPGGDAAARAPAPESGRDDGDGRTDEEDDRPGGKDYLSDDEADPLDPFDPFPEPVTIEIEDVFDLHTIAPRDVKRVVEEYLLEARRAGFRSVRIIHGKGRGVQRETVRRILARTDFVHSFADAPPHAGGLGATVAHLRETMNDERGTTKA